MRRAFSRKAASPSLRLIELTIALALEALEPRLDHLPLRGVDHHRDPGDVGLGGDEVQEGPHRRGGVEQRLVHVDVDHLRAVLHLLARDLERRVVVAALDQLGELRRAGDVGALADVHEQRVGPDRERLEPGEPRVAAASRHGARRQALHRLRDGADVRRRRAAAPAHDVEEAAGRELPQHRRHLLGALVVAAEGVGEAGVGVAAHRHVGDRATAPRRTGAARGRRARS